MRLAVALIAAMLLLCSAEAEDSPWPLAKVRVEAEHWGYRPVTEAEAVNPPGFTWAPEDGAVKYHLQVSTAEDFSSLAYEVDDSAWSSHAPSETLPAGVALHWRYRAFEGERGWSDWSETRNFKIAEDAVHFPKPLRAGLIERLPTEHPRLFMRPEGLDTLRGRIASDLAPHWQHALAEAEAVLAKPPDATEPPLYPEGTKVKSKEWRDIWWGNRVRSFALMEAAAKCAFAYRLSGEQRFGQMARELTMAFAAWDPKGSTQYTYNDEAAMPLLYWPARAYTWAYDVFSPEEREKIIAVMRVRGADCFEHLRNRGHLWKPYASHSNRAWHKLAETAVAFHSEIPEAAEWLDLSMTIFYTCYPVWGGDDGGWHEGTAYWLSYLSRFNYWAVTMKTSLGLDAFRKPFFSETGYYGMYSLPPGAVAGAWGDQAQGTTFQRSADFMGYLAAVTGKQDWTWYAQEGGFDLSKRGWFGLTAASLLPHEPAPKAPVDMPTSRVFPDTGLAVLNSNLMDGTDNVQVHFKSSRWGTQSHGYNANNSFMVYVHGKPLLTLTGKRDIYGSPHHSKWMWHSKSDNAILFNGEGQRMHTAKAQGMISGYHLSDDVDIVQGEAGESYDEVEQWTRRLYFFKPDLILIHDRVKAKEAGRWQWLLHSMAPFELRDDGALSAQGDVSANVTFLHPQGLNLSQDDQFDPPPHDWAKSDLKQWHLSAEPADALQEADFLVAIAMNGAKVEVDATPRGQGFDVRVTLPGQRAYCIATDKEVAASVERKGKETAAAP